MRRRDEDGGASELGWMFEPSQQELMVPVPSQARRRGDERSSRWALGASSSHSANGRRTRGSSGQRITVTRWTSLVIALCMFLHEVVAKSLSNGFVLFIVAIPPITFLSFAVQRWAHKVDAAVTVELFFRGFGPGFLLLLFTEAFCGITLMGYYCAGIDCSPAVGVVYDLRRLPAFLYERPPVRGLILTFVLSFFTAGLLEEGTKLFFVSNAIDFVLHPHMPRMPAFFAKAAQGGKSGKVAVALASSPTSNYASQPEVEMQGSPLHLAGFRDADGGSLLDFPDAELAQLHGAAEPRLPPPPPLSKPATTSEPSVATSRHGILVYFLAFSFGLATSESMLYLCTLAPTPRDALLMAGSRIMFSLPMHAACGCFTGLGLIERHMGGGMPLWRVLGPSVLLHGAYDFALLMVRLTPYFDVLSEEHMQAAKYAVSALFLVATGRELAQRLRVYFYKSQQ